MSLVRTSLIWERGSPGAWPVPHSTSRKIPVRPPQRCHMAVRATSTVGLASRPPGGRRAASTLDRATPLVCHTGRGPGQSSRRPYPVSDADQTRVRRRAASAVSLRTFKPPPPAPSVTSSPPSPSIATTGSPSPSRAPAGAGGGGDLDTGVALGVAAVTALGQFGDVSGSVPYCGKSASTGNSLAPDAVTPAGPAGSSTLVS